MQLHKDLTLIQSSAVRILIFLLICEQRALNFYFELGPTIFVTCLIHIPGLAVVKQGRQGKSPTPGVGKAPPLSMEQRSGEGSGS